MNSPHPEWTERVRDFPAWHRAYWWLERCYSWYETDPFLDLAESKNLIVGSGIDLAEVDRIEAAVTRYGDRFLARILTPRERAYVERKANRFERIAARFAAKEAGMKAIGTGWRRGVGWHDFEVANQPSGKPTLLFHGVAAQVAERLKVKTVSLSLTHTKQYGMALVLLED